MSGISWIGRWVFFFLPLAPPGRPPRWVTWLHSTLQVSNWRICFLIFNSNHVLISSIRRKHFKISCGLLCILYSVLLRKAKHDLTPSLAPEPLPWHGVCPQAHSGCEVLGPLSRLPGGSYGSTPVLLSRRDCGLHGTVSERQPVSSHLLHGSLPTKEMAWNSFVHLPAARNCIKESTLWAWAWNEELPSVSGGLGLPDHASSSRCADPSVAVWTKGIWERRPNGTNKREQGRDVTTWSSHWGQNPGSAAGWPWASTPR